MRIVGTALELDQNQWSPERDVERSQGLHLSHILKFIEHELGKRYDSGFGGQHFMMTGFLWERILERALNEPDNPNIIRPGEQYLDGIYMTPDGYNVEDECLEEWKATWMSMNNPIDGPKFQRWFWQIMSYCKALGLTKARLRVLYINGDYREQRGPTPIQYDIAFTQSEIDDNWEMVYAHSKIMEKRGLIDPEGT